MRKTNFDLFPKEQLKDPDFAGGSKKRAKPGMLQVQARGAPRKGWPFSKELARKLKTSQQNVSRLESPSYEGHSLSMLRRVAGILGATVRVVIEPRKIPAAQLSRRPTTVIAAPGERTDRHKSCERRGSTITSGPGARIAVRGHELLGPKSRHCVRLDIDIDNLAILYDPIPGEI